MYRKLLFTIKYNFKYKQHKDQHSNYLSSIYMNYLYQQHNFMQSISIHYLHSHKFYLNYCIYIINNHSIKILSIHMYIQLVLNLHKLMVSRVIEFHSMYINFTINHNKLDPRFIHITLMEHMFHQPIYILHLFLSNFNILIMFLLLNKLQLEFNIVCH